MAEVLVVADEGLVRAALSASLAAAGFSVHEARDVAASRRVLAEGRIDVAVVDLSVPDVDGLALVADLRAAGDIGLIVVGSEHQIQSPVAALDAGADDYVAAPADPAELAARIRSLLRRRRPRGAAVQLGRWIVDVAGRRVLNGAEAVQLTPGEFDILVRLIRSGGAMVTREDLLNQISRRPDLADVLVSRLRPKLGDRTRRLIMTVSTHGYRIGELTLA